MDSLDFKEGSHCDGDVTQLLIAIQKGDQSATEALFCITCDQLRRLAGSAMRNQTSDQLLQPTVLVNEVVVRILKSNSLANTRNRRMFYGLAARAMRSVLTDYARNRLARKRNVPNASARDYFDNLIGQIERHSRVDLMALDEALAQLRLHCRRKHEIVVMRFFGGLAFKEIAEHLRLSLSTVEKDWAFARAWLRRRLG